MLELNRSFVSIDFPYEIVEEVKRIQSILHALNFSGKLTELKNLHLTLKFLGELSSVKLDEVVESLKKVKQKMFEAELEELGIFSFRGSPRIVWIKVGGKGVFELQSKVDSCLENLGFQKEKRFMSHMTIARVKYAQDKSAFDKYIRRIKIKRIKFKIREFKLNVSELKSKGAVYRVIEKYSLECK